ncbi:hypothetical protein HPB48_014366 [Haemaphysalis longicornis]|uniref:Uncharacterized protein n=1 Tax=Haemaphysalis longicornis TaxID=44386 RepID=A0A9J6FTG7_HAELO|nr:hypothetical protein HPB48_014366 [Haemaphysalis longicornis]
MRSFFVKMTHRSCFFSINVGQQLNFGQPSSGKVMSSEGSPQATGAAAPDRFSRDPPSPSGPSAYRTLLPTLPIGKLNENALFLHEDPSGSTPSHLPSRTSRT